jgi:hypothetical protein
MKDEPAFTVLCESNHSPGQHYVEIRAAISSSFRRL